MTENKVEREQKVLYGLKKFKNPQRNTVINKEKIKIVNGKKIKQIETETIKRNKVKASNKLPLTGKKKRKRRLSNKINISLIS